MQDMLKQLSVVGYGERTRIVAEERIFAVITKVRDRFS